MNRKTGWTIVVVIACVVGALGLHHYKKSKVAVVATPKTLVKLSGVTVKSIPEVVHASATLSASQKATIMPKVGGYVNQINFEEGQFVKKGAMLVQLDDTSQKQAYLADQATTQFAKITEQRYLQLVKVNAAAKQDLDQYISSYKKAIAQEKADKTALDEMTLRAPISGFLGTTTFHVGDYIPAGTDIVHLTDTRMLKVNYSLPSYYAAKLKVGQKVILSSSSISDKNITAKVSYVAPTVDEATQTIEVHALVDNTDNLLKPGESVEIAQYLGVMPNTLLVPSSSVITSVDGTHVYQVEGNKVIETTVVTGDRYHSMTVIKKGLSATSKYISEGQFQVKIGQQVKITE